MPGGKSVPVVVAVIPLSSARVLALIPWKVWFSMNAWLSSATVSRDEAVNAELTCNSEIRELVFDIHFLENFQSLYEQRHLILVNAVFRVPPVINLHSHWYLTMGTKAPLNTRDRVVLRVNLRRIHPCEDSDPDIQKCSNMVGNTSSKAILSAERKIIARMCMMKRKYQASTDIIYIWSLLP